MVHEMRLTCWGAQRCLQITSFFDGLFCLMAPGSWHFKLSCRWPFSPLAHCPSPNPSSHLGNCTLCSPASLTSGWCEFAYLEYNLHAGSQSTHWLPMTWLSVTFESPHPRSSLPPRKSLSGPVTLETATHLFYFKYPPWPYLPTPRLIFCFSGSYGMIALLVNFVLDLSLINFRKCMLVKLLLIDKILVSWMNSRWGNKNKKRPYDLQCAHRALLCQWLSMEGFLKP